MSTLTKITTDMKDDKTPLMVYSLIDHNEFLYTKKLNTLIGIDKKNYKNIELSFFLDIINSNLINTLKDYITSDINKMELIRNCPITFNNSLDIVHFLILEDINSIRMFINSKIDIYSKIDFDKDVFIPYIETLINDIQEIQSLMNKCVNITKNKIKLEYLNSYNNNFVLPVSNITYLLEYNGLYYSKQSKNVKEFLDYIPEIIKSSLKNNSNSKKPDITKKEYSQDEIQYFERITMESQSKNNKYVVMENFNIYNIYDLIRLSLYLFYRDNLVILKCKNCNKLFIPKTRNSETLCDNIYKNGKTCKQLSSEIKLENDEIGMTYRKAYKSEHQRMKNKLKHYKDNKDYCKKLIEKFNKWNELAKNKRSECKNGSITLDQYKEWITENEDYTKNEVN